MDKKNPKEASNLFEGIIKASVKGNPAPAPPKGSYIIELQDNTYISAESDGGYIATGSIGEAKRYRDRSTAVSAIDTIALKHFNVTSKAKIIKI